MMTSIWSCNAVQICFSIQILQRARISATAKLALFGAACYQNLFIFLLIKNSNGNIIYYNINSQGTVDNNKTETLESNGDYPAITGTNDKIYAIYKAGNYIKGKYSTNGGTDWSELPYTINTGSNACNGIDANYQDQLGVHLVYAMRDNGNYFETYYYLLNTSFPPKSPFALSWISPPFHQINLAHASA